MDHVAVIRDEAQRLATVLSSADPEAPVPTCPDWSASDLLWHLTEVHLFWGGILEEGATTDEQVKLIDEAKPERPDTVAGMLPLRAKATDKLSRQLERTHDDVPRWTWWPADQTVGFTRRMQVCEATMHRVDAELAAGVRRTPIRRDVAAALVDQCVDVMWGWMPEWAAYQPDGVIELIAADTDQRWLVEVGHWTGTGPESGKEFNEPMAKRAASDATPTATVAAPVIDLALWSWRRGGVVETGGDADLVAAFTTLVENGIQ